MSMSTEGQQPPRKEPEPPLRRALRIGNVYPNVIYKRICDQLDKNRSGEEKDPSGELIGFVYAKNPGYPLHSVRTIVYGNLTSLKDSDHEPNSDQIKEKDVKLVNIQTEFTLPNHTLFDQERTLKITSIIEKFGSRSNVVTQEDGSRIMRIATPDGTFDLDIGFLDDNSSFDYHVQQLRIYRKRYPDKVPLMEEIVRKLGTNGEETKILLNISNSQLGQEIKGTLYESKEQILKLIERCRDLTEIVATALAQTTVATRSN
jgi:hypothetical protein